MVQEIETKPLNKLTSRNGASSQNVTTRLPES
jgi:hypothetical protein